MIKEKLEKQIQIAQDKLKVIEIYPDIEEHIDRWNKSYLISKSVNNLVDNVYLKHNCGCCHDSPLEAWTYTTINGVNIYSNPPYFTIGEKYDYCEDKPYPNWESKLIENNIPKHIIEKIQQHFDEHQPT